MRSRAFATGPLPRPATLGSMPALGSKSTKFGGGARAMIRLALAFLVCFVSQGVWVDTPLAAFSTKPVRATEHKVPWASESVFIVGSAPYEDVLLARADIVTDASVPGEAREYVYISTSSDYGLADFVWRLLISKRIKVGREAINFIPNRKFISWGLARIPEVYMSEYIIIICHDFYVSTDNGQIGAELAIGSVLCDISLSSSLHERFRDSYSGLAGFVQRRAEQEHASYTDVEQQFSPPSHALLGAQVAKVIFGGLIAFAGLALSIAALRYGLGLLVFYAGGALGAAGVAMVVN